MSRAQNLIGEAARLDHWRRSLGCAVWQPIATTPFASVAKLKLPISTRWLPPIRKEAALGGIIGSESMESRNFSGQDTRLEATPLQLRRQNHRNASFGYCHGAQGGINLSRALESCPAAHGKRLYGCLPSSLSSRSPYLNKPTSPGMRCGVRSSTVAKAKARKS